MASQQEKIDGFVNSRHQFPRLMGNIALWLSGITLSVGNAGLAIAEVVNDGFTPDLALDAAGVAGGIYVTRFAAGQLRTVIQAVDSYPKEAPLAQDISDTLTQPPTATE